MLKLKKYKNRIIAFILFFIFIFSLPFVTSCSNDLPTEENQSNCCENCEQKEIAQPDNSQPYKEFDLSVDNVNYFFDFKYSKDISADQLMYNITGVLDYAYYDNVTITFDVVYTIDPNEYNKEKEIYSGEYSIALNAAGDASFYCNDPELLKAIGWDSYNSLYLKRQITVSAVAGKIVLF